MTQPRLASETEHLLLPDQQDIAQHFSAIGGLSLIIPIRVSDLSSLAGFKEHFDDVLCQMEKIHAWEFIIVDASLEGIFAIIDQWFAHRPHVYHIRPITQNIPGHNNKLLSLAEALSRAQFRYAILLDHDMRPSFQSICVKADGTASRLKNGYPDKTHSKNTFKKTPTGQTPIEMRQAHLSERRWTKR